MHTDGQQHRASTNRAHSRRHVIIVSVVVRWCGADLHSEGHGEQQGRREVRQTHTEGTPHEERAAARHAPYAAHHARHTLQSTATNTHTHSPAAAPTHRWKRENQTGAAHKAPPHLNTARAVRRVGTPHGGCAHTQEEVQRTQQHKSKVTIKRERSPHTTWIVGPWEVQPTFITKTIQLPFGLRSYSAHTTSCRHGHHSSSSRTHNKNKKKQKRGGGVGDRGAAVTVSNSRTIHSGDGDCFCFLWCCLTGCRSIVGIGSFVATCFSVVRPWIIVIIFIHRTLSIVTVICRDEWCCCFRMAAAIGNLRQS
ncbi:mucin-associated surface protein (MASP) [Trypanosoma cruzi]|nr:mucin-associated surface protein (MASP) [Trypanosoma cruzi]